MPIAKVKLGVTDFGQQLIETKDLDPVYVVLWNADLGYNRLCAWLVAYWCFYHCGTANWILDSPNYWEAMLTAAGSKHYPRSSERRHFRGQQAIKAVTELINRRQSPWQIVRSIGAREETITAQVAMQRAKKLRGFGDWIAFKVADMLERLRLCNVVFKPDDVFSMFESPRLGAELMLKHYYPAGTVEPCQFAYDTITECLGRFMAPPSYNRTINIQEVETILCKWKSHMNGHYHVGKDIHEIQEGILRFEGPTGYRMMDAGSKGGLW